MERQRVVRASLSTARPDRPRAAWRGTGDLARFKQALDMDEEYDRSRGHGRGRPGRRRQLRTWPSTCGWWAGPASVGMDLIRCSAPGRLGDHHPVHAGFRARRRRGTWLERGHVEGRPTCCASRNEQHRRALGVHASNLARGQELRAIPAEGGRVADANEPTLGHEKPRIRGGGAKRPERLACELSRARELSAMDKKEEAHRVASRSRGLIGRIRRLASFTLIAQSNISTDVRRTAPFAGAGPAERTRPG